MSWCAMADENKKVFLHYTQAELDRNYDQRAWCPDSAEYLARYPRESEAFRRSTSYRTLSYGDAEDEKLDIFPAAEGDAAALIFIHGGAWRNFTKDDFSFVARCFVPEGFSVIVLNFSKLPQKRLPGVLDQLRGAMTWIHRHAADLGIDATRLFLCGHSSGAHLSALLATTDWREHRLPPDLVKGCALISGSYDLAPAVLSARGSYISVTKREERDLSPVHFADRLSCPVFIAYAEHDTDEFRRQSLAFAEAARRAGKPCDHLRMPGINHFAIVEHLAQQDSPLLSALLQRLRTWEADLPRRDGV
jgi:arylformamidase